jgi:PilZ domain-containing protein
MHTCDESQEIHPDHKPDTDAERRAGARFRAADAAIMKVLQPLGAKAAEVQVLDVSQDGLQLRVPAHLQPGSIVQIDLKNTVALAEVRYCVPSEPGFHAGVQLQDVVWTGDSTG